MPPYFLCISDWFEMLLESIVIPFATTEADVSSQEVSIPRISTNSLLVLLEYGYAFRQSEFKKSIFQSGINPDVFQAHLDPV